jgi:hypothetical protein
MPVVCIVQQRHGAPFSGELLRVQDGPGLYIQGKQAVIGHRLFAFIRGRSCVERNQQPPASEDNLSPCMVSRTSIHALPGLFCSTTDQSFCASGGSVGARNRARQTGTVSKAEPRAIARNSSLVMRPRNSERTMAQTRRIETATATILDATTAPGAFTRHE